MRILDPEKITIVSMAVALIRAGVPASEREAIRLLSRRFKPHDVLRHAGEALALAQRAAAAKPAPPPPARAPSSLPSERLAFFARDGKRLN